MKRFTIMFALSSLVGCMLPMDDVSPDEGTSSQALEAEPNGFIFETCAEAGCPNRPSGSPDIWTPCTVVYPCFCDTRPAPAGIVRCLMPR